MMKIFLWFAMIASAFIAVVQVFVFFASYYVPALLVAIWAMLLVPWCYELIEEYSEPGQRRTRRSILEYCFGFFWKRY